MNSHIYASQECKLNTPTRNTHVPTPAYTRTTHQSRAAGTAAPENGLNSRVDRGHATDARDRCARQGPAGHGPFHAQEEAAAVC